MSSPRETAERILSHNTGFAHPEQWVDYAVRRGFSFVRSTPVPLCPDCAAGASRVLGHYVFYSTLIHLRECSRCSLIWSDVRIDPDIVREDLERTYHGHDREEYFTVQRRAVFDHLAELVNSVAPRDGTVLDVGGAQGHLMARVRSMRRDLTAWVHDLTATATRYARVHFGLPTIEGDLDALQARGLAWDVIVMSDMLYYEPDLERLWAVLGGLLKPGGWLLIRVPNKVRFIRAGALLQRLREKIAGRPQDRLPLFNPAHIYVLSRRYLTRRLRGLGFDAIRVLPSPVLLPGNRLVQHACAALFRVVRSVNQVIPRLVLTPSLVIQARRPGYA